MLILAIVKSKATIELLLVVVSVFSTLLVACGQTINPQPAPSPGKTTTIDLLHTNDVHGHLENMPRLSTAITRIRESSAKDSVMLLDAGDVFSTSVYFRLYQEQASLWFMNYLGYDAMCLGNHEFDDGLDTLARFVTGAKFHVVSSNIQFPPENMTGNSVAPWVITEKDGVRYGILGLTTERTAELSSLPANVKISDPVSAARRAVNDLKSNNIDRIIAITHLGWDEDLKLAREVGDIDIIIGGHTYTLPAVYPKVIDEDGSPTLIAQAGEDAKYLGHLRVSFDGAGVIQDWTGSKLVPLDEAIPGDIACTAKLAEYRMPVAKMLATVIATTLADLDGDRATVRSRETNLGNLVADSMLRKASQTGAVIAIMNAGGIRASIAKGDVTLEQIMAVLPFDNYLVVTNLTGEQITAALENGVSQVEEEQGRFPQVAGLRYVWDSAAKPGSRIISVEIGKAGRYESINPAATYRVATNNFVHQGGDGYTMFPQGNDPMILGYTDYEMLAEYITANSPVNPQVQGRISRK